MSKLKKVLENVEMALKVRRIKGLFVAGGGLYESGWVESKRTKKIVDKEGKPVPWYSFSAICFLKERLNTEMNIFEFGCGFSTRFYVERVNSVEFVEHDKEWHDSISNLLRDKDNVTSHYAEEVDEYTNTLFLNDRKYDVIVVDGIYRNECLQKSIKALKPDGIIILDNSERKEYEAGIMSLLKLGFGKLDFWGIPPGNWGLSCTSFFYKKDNCFKL